MEQAYAQALWTIIEKGMKPEDAVRAMHDKLKGDGREALMPRIAKAFERLATAMSARDAVTLTVADATHEHAALKSAGAALSKIGVEAKEVQLRTDATLIGGWRLEGKEALIDASYKKQLLEIYTSATQ